MDEKLVNQVSKFLYYILDENKKVQPAKGAKEWEDWINSGLYHRVVRRDLLPPGIVVSTVFIGLGLEFIDDEPTLFETATYAEGMTEKQKHQYDWATGHMHRYTTYEDAVDGHRVMVLGMKNKLDEYHRLEGGLLKDT